MDSSERKSNIGVCIQSKIPKLMVAKSKIPIRATVAKKVESTTGIPRKTGLYLEKTDKGNIIKPRVTKRSVPYKDYSVIKTKVTPVTKRRSSKTGTPRRKSLQKSKQSTLQKRLETGSLMVKKDEGNSLNSSGEKENILPPNPKEQPVFEKRSRKDMQSELNIDFEPNELYRQFILNNKELPLNSLKISTPTKKSKATDPYETAMARIRELREKRVSLNNQNTSVHKTFLGNISHSNGFNSNKLNSKECSPTVSRRCTWSSSQTKIFQFSPDSYESPVSKVERRSCMKLSLVGRNYNYKRLWSSPRNGGGCNSPQSPARDAYSMTMQKILALKEARRGSQKTQLFSPLLDSFVRKRSSVYRPLQSLLQTSGRKKPFSLDDISEKNESEITCDSRNASAGGNVDDISSKLESVQLQSSVKEKTTVDAAVSPIHTSTPFNYVLDSCNYGVKQKASYFAKPIINVDSGLTNYNETPIHAPTPISVHRKTYDEDDLFLRHSISKPISIAHCAPICTPFVLKNMARDNEDNKLLKPVKVKLDFEKEDQDINDVLSRVVNGNDLENPRISYYSRFANHIKTKKQQEEQLADEECEFYLSKQINMVSSCRNLCNPVSTVLRFGDDRHFIPINRYQEAN